MFSSELPTPVQWPGDVQASANRVSNSVAPRLGLGTIDHAPPADDSIRVWAPLPTL
jgi:hypothetical protein